MFGSPTSLIDAIMFSIAPIANDFPRLMLSAIVPPKFSLCKSVNGPSLAGENGNRFLTLPIKFSAAAVTLLAAALIPSAIILTILLPAFLNADPMFVTTFSAPVIPVETALLTPLIALDTIPRKELKMFDIVFLIPFTTDVIVERMPFQMLEIVERTEFITLEITERIALNTVVTTLLTLFTTVVITFLIVFQIDDTVLDTFPRILLIVLSIFPKTPFTVPHIPPNVLDKNESIAFQMFCSKS